MATPRSSRFLVVPVRRARMELALSDRQYADIDARLEQVPTIRRWPLTALPIATSFPADTLTKPSTASVTIVPQEDPQAFRQAMIDVDRIS